MSELKPTISTSMEIAHSLKGLISERPKFKSLLSDHQYQLIIWVTENFPLESSVTAKPPNYWKNNYSKAVEAAASLAPYIPLLKQKLSSKSQTEVSVELNTRTEMASSNDFPLPKASLSSTLSDEQFSKLVEAVRAQIAPPSAPSAPLAAEITDGFISQLTNAIQNKMKSSSVSVDSTQAPLTTTTNLPGMNLDYSLRPQDIGFFSPDNEASYPTSVVEGKTYYHDIFSFTNRIRAKADSGGNGQWVAASLAAKLDLCLKGEAELWYTNELSAITRAGLTTNLNFWCSELERRFQESPSVALGKLERLRYTVKDVQARKKPEEFVNRIIVLGRHAGTATTEYTQILTAYHHIDVALRVSLSKPTKNTTLSNFMANVTETKEIWFDLYRPVFSSYSNHAPHSRPMPPTNNYKPQARQYTPNPHATQNKFQQPQGKQNYITLPNRRMGNFRSRQYLPQQKPSDRWHNETNHSENSLKPAPNFPVNPVDSSGVSDNNSLQNYSLPQNQNDSKLFDHNPNDQYISESFDANAYDEAFSQEYDNTDEKYDNPYQDYENRYVPDTYHISNSLLPNVNSTIAKVKSVATYRPTFEKSQSQSPILCSACNKSFSSRNKLHNHITTLHEKSKNPPLVETDPLSIIESTAINSTSPPGFGFRGRSYAQIQIMLHSPGNDKTWVYLDSGCTMSLIDKNYLFQKYPTAKLLTMSTPMTVRGIGHHM
ncbi:hypothetical protein HI914_00911 [Erysiphe necator]|nr:hypothetical protein HI914_00911 [Erysiphe necator]